ncbi:hypothetical protein GCM10016272_06180 [Psychrobacter glaciei]|uniref:DUF11 domain-containing protein n=1 Tax=Psychrobacter glaciei TaxID=619771 RepID=A0ABQ3GMY3_9GAMM|nr:hypothetical protein [Psychrobacter glaciei]GHD27676.1 hypothetical protein GCM10016272_06180 [Psychrobacter glaciei]
MYIDKYFAGSKSIDLFQKYKFILLTLVGFISSFLISYSSYAIAPNPGAVCSADFSQGSLTNADYSSLASAVNTNNYVTVAGNAAGSIPLQIKISTTESSSNTTLSNFGVIESGGVRAINVRRTFPNTTAFTDINLDFRNSITAQPIFLTNVALSAFDIDYANSNGNTFDDLIRITGVTQTGTTITGTLQPIVGSNIISNLNPPGLITRTIADPNCPAKDLGTQCQGSVQFSEPVTSVSIRYTNTGFLPTATNQEIDFRVDNYCYVPQYIFSGTVFDDNGGITAAQASATNADITTASSAYANRPNYFNGRYDPTAPETGITGSTVQLANCSNTSTTYPTQSVIRNGAPVGEYQISIPKTTLANNTNLCLVESRTGNTYPIRTSNESRTVGFAATTYNYPNNDFGRVIAANAALVLRKAQYVNNCPATLNYSDSTLNVSGNTDPRTGFSEGGINGNIIPGQCIAYRITATNRANIDINNFVMKDVLQKQGVDGATVTSVLANPALSTTDYTTSENPAIGGNGEVKTKSLTLTARAKRDFYFNTKYGTIANNQ